MAGEAQKVSEYFREFNCREPGSPRVSQGIEQSGADQSEPSITVTDQSEPSIEQSGAGEMHRI